MIHDILVKLQRAMVATVTGSDSIPGFDQRERLQLFVWLSLLANSPSSTQWHDWDQTSRTANSTHMKFLTSCLTLFLQLWPFLQILSRWVTRTSETCQGGANQLMSPQGAIRIIGWQTSIKIWNRGNVLFLVLWCNHLLLLHRRSYDWWSLLSVSGWVQLSVMAQCCSSWCWGSNLHISSSCFTTSVSLVSGDKNTQWSDKLTAVLSVWGWGVMQAESCVGRTGQDRSDGRSAKSGPSASQSPPTEEAEGGGGGGVGL